MQKVSGVLQDYICVRSVSRYEEYLQDAASRSEMYSYRHSALKTCAYDILLFIAVHEDLPTSDLFKFLTAT